MSAVLDYIFKHKYYREVLSAYSEVSINRVEAFKVWCSYYNHEDDSTYSFKQIIFSHINEIREIDSWVRITTRYISTNKQAVEWLFHDYNIDGIPTLSYNEYKLIGTSESRLKEYASTYLNFQHIYINHVDASLYFLNIAPNTLLSFEQIKKIATSEETIKEIDSLLKRANQIKESYPKAWGLFSKGEDVLKIPIDRLKSINSGFFSIKEQFLSLYEERKELIKLILGIDTVPIDTFDENTFKNELYVINSLSEIEDLDFNSFDGDIKIEDEKALKRAILDSEYYGVKCNFVDSYSIRSFYNLRFNLEEVGVNFDTAYTKVDENREAVKAYNTEQGNEKTVYINNYLESVSPDQPLYQYIETYRQEKSKRDEAKKIKEKFPLGFSSIFSDIDITTCSISQVISIIDSYSRIESKHNELHRIEQERIEAERKRQEEERKKQEVNDLKNCVAPWPYPNRANVHYFSLYNYYPTTCEWNASESEWDIRNLIWDFKADPHNYQPEEEIIRRNRKSVDTVLPLLRKVLHHYFGSSVRKLTIVPIPASTKIVCDRRYKHIMQRICDDMDMYNGYEHMTITKEGISKNNPSNTTGRSIPPVVEYDASFFKDKYVILFDDVITSGASMERYKRLLEAAGATVICGLSLGKTRHERQSSHPIDTI